MSGTFFALKSVGNEYKNSTHVGSRERASARSQYGKRTIRILAARKLEREQKSQRSRGWWEEREGKMILQENFLKNPSTETFSRERP